MLCVPLVGIVGHKWIPSTPPGTTPLVPYSSRGEGFGVPGACADLPSFEAMQLALVKACFAVATGH